MANTDYCTVADVKAGTNITDSSLDTEIQGIIDDVSRAIDDRTGSRFYQDDSDVARSFLPENSGRCIIYPGLSSFTSLSTALNPTDFWTQGTDFFFEPLNAPADGAPWTMIRTIARPFLFTKADVPAGWATLDGRITVTGKWGWASVPGPVHRAAIFYARRLFDRRFAPLGIQVGSLDVPGMRIPRTDADAEALLEPYVLTWFA